MYFCREVILQFVFRWNTLPTLSHSLKRRAWTCRRKSYSPSETDTVMLCLRNQQTVTYGLKLVFVNKVILEHGHGYSFIHGCLSALGWLRKTSAQGNTGYQEACQLSDSERENSWSCSSLNAVSFSIRLCCFKQSLVFFSTVFKAGQGYTGWYCLSNRID